MKSTFVIDSLPESALRYQNGFAVVVVDVIRATTMAITAVSMGCACYPVSSLDAALQLARRLHDPLMAGECQGETPAGFDMNNSPAELTERSDTSRPLIMLSSSGTKLIINARGADAVYLACFRNSLSTARRLVSEAHPRIALLGAGSRGESREEDQICCAWIGAQLVQAGYTPATETTVEVLSRWANAQPHACLISRSVDYLRRTGQLADLRFILDRIDDLDETFIFRNDEVVMVTPDVRLSRLPDRVPAY